MHYFVEFCRDRRLRTFVKILAKSLFSYPCLGQNLSSTPGSTVVLVLVIILPVAGIDEEDDGIDCREVILPHSTRLVMAAKIECGESARGGRG